MTMANNPDPITPSGLGTKGKSLEINEKCEQIDGTALKFMQKSLF